jgi:hypothetical protein
LGWHRDQAKASRHFRRLCPKADQQPLNQLPSIRVVPGQNDRRRIPDLGEHLHHMVKRPRLRLADCVADIEYNPIRRSPAGGRTAGHLIPTDLRHGV